jgi:hypothetical protein
MAGKAVPGMEGVRVFPPPPKGFDALAASKTDLARHGLPQRPDPRTQPDQRRCRSSAHAATRVLSTWSPNLFPPISPRNPLPRASGCRSLSPAGSSCSSALRSPY